MISGGFPNIGQVNVFAENSEEAEEASSWDVSIREADDSAEASSETDQSRMVPDIEEKIVPEKVPTPVKSQSEAGSEEKESSSEEISEAASAPVIIQSEADKKKLKNSQKKETQAPKRSRSKAGSKGQNKRYQTNASKESVSEEISEEPPTQKRSRSEAGSKGRKAPPKQTASSKRKKGHKKTVSEESSEETPKRSRSKKQKEETPKSLADSKQDEFKESLVKIQPYVLKDKVEGQDVLLAKLCNAIGQKNVALIPVNGTHQQLTAALGLNNPNVVVLYVQRAGRFGFKPYFFISLELNGRIIIKGGIFKDDNVQKKLRELLLGELRDAWERGELIFTIDFAGIRFLVILIPQENTQIGDINAGDWHTSLGGFVKIGAKAVEDNKDEIAKAGKTVKDLISLFT